MRRKITGNPAGRILGMLCLASLLSSGAATVAPAQSLCEAELTEARQKYETGFFDEAIDLIDRCLNQSGLSAATQLRAYRLKALIYQAKDDGGQAKEAVRKLLQLAPNYQPDPVQDPPPYIELVGQVQQELPTAPVAKVPSKKKKGGATKWILIGGGVGTAAIAAVILSSGGGNGDGGTTLPTPPPLP